jgi:hypothetical protein
MRSTLLSIVLIALMSATILAEDINISGEWNCVIPRMGKSMFDFEVNGSKLTGSKITNDIETYILDGKINGDKISFKTKGDTGNTNFEFIYDGKIISAKEIEFKMKTLMMKNAMTITTFTARRAGR